MTTDGPVSEGGNKANVEGCAVVLGLVFAAVGIGALIAAVASTLFALDARSWTETPCRILTAVMDESKSDDGTTYRADFTYAYEFDGKNYVGRRDSVMESFGSRKAAKKRLDSFPVGTETFCRVDPDEPSEAVLDASFPKWWLLGMTMFGILFGSVGSFVAYKSFRAMRAEKRRKKSTQSRLGRVSNIAEQDDYFQTDVIDRDEELESQSMANPSSGDSVSVRGRGAPTVHPEDVADRKADVPQRLKAQSSRLGALVGVTLMALFWNGIVSVFLWVLFFDNPGGFMGWGLGLFLIPFVLIGLLLIFGIVHSFVSLFNPSVSVALSSGAVSRGGNIDVAWEVSGGIRSIDSLRINIIGTEWARYQRGTDTIVDESTFEVVPVFSTDQSDDIRFGSSSVSIPAETMHTLDLANNKIKWEVVVSGTIAWWPDVTGKYPFRVTPHQVGSETTGSEGSKK